MFNNKKIGSNGRIEEQKKLHKTSSKMANVIIPYE